MRSRLVSAGSALLMLGFCAVGGGAQAAATTNSAPTKVFVTGGGHSTLVYGLDLTGNGTGTITTDPSSTATLAVDTGDTIDIGPGSAVDVRSQDAYTLVKGSLHILWTNFAQGLREPTITGAYLQYAGHVAVASVRGTEAVVVDGGASITFQDLKGHLSVSVPPRAGTANLATGTQITVTRGSVPRASQVVRIKDVNRFWTAAHTLSVIPCPIPSEDYSGTQYVAQPPPATVTVPRSLAPPGGAQFYGTVFPGGAPSYLLGAASAACQAAWGSASGGAFMTASAANNNSQSVNMVIGAGGAGPETDLACPYIPATLAAEQSFRGNTSLCARPSGDVVQQIPTGSSNLYSAVVWVPGNVKDPNLTSSGDGSDPTVALYTAQVIPPASGGQPETADAQMISCTLPVAQRGICAASLAYFLGKQSDVGAHVPKADVSKMQGALLAFLLEH